jgi:hypothetical protein
MKPNFKKLQSAGSLKLWDTFTLPLSSAYIKCIMWLETYIMPLILIMCKTIIIPLTLFFFIKKIKIKIKISDHGDPQQHHGSLAVEITHDQILGLETRGSPIHVRPWIGSLQKIVGLEIHDSPWSDRSCVFGCPQFSFFFFFKCKGIIKIWIMCITRSTYDAFFVEFNIKF